MHPDLAGALERLGVRPGDRIGAAVSGGADSVALLHLLAAQRPVHVLHVDHGLRPESGEDARFVTALAEDLGVPCSVLAARVAAGGSPEAAARAARYAALDSAAARLRLDWIATAHTQDDQAETVLMRAIRGSGSGGLGGIPPVRGVFVRPLLDVRRGDLRGWLSAQGLEWREDASNGDVRYERNWVRHELMPVIERRRPGAAAALARAGALARADDDALESLASDVLAAAEVDDAGVLLSDVGGLPRAIAARVVRRACWSLGYEPSHSQVRRLLAGDGAPCGPVSGHELARGLAILREPVVAPAPLPVTDRPVTSPGWGIRVHRAVRGEGWSSPVPPGSRLMIRSRRPGDRVRTRAGTRKVSDVLVDAKVPRALRDFVPVLASADGALAVVGLTRYPGGGEDVVCVQPDRPSWSRAVVWS